MLGFSRRWENKRGVLEVPKIFLWNKLEEIDRLTMHLQDDQLDCLDDNPEWMRDLIMFDFDKNSWSNNHGMN